MENVERKTVNIGDGVIQDIILRKDEVDVCFTNINGQNEEKLFLKEGESVMLTVNCGDVSNVTFGGTDNWGKDRLPLFLDFERDKVNYDSVFVNTIEIQKLAGEGNWCKCELINGNKNVKYTALSQNPYNVERKAYFYHKTTDKTVNAGFNEGRPVAKEWCVTVIQNANPKGIDPSVDPQPKPTPTPEPTPSPDQDEKKLGAYKYSIGIISDLHICEENDKKTSSDSDDWWDEDDFKAAMDIFVADKNIKCVMACGDLAESQTNDYDKHPKETCNADYNDLIKLYDVPYWQVAGLRLFTPLGNHDFYGLFESRNGDTITGKKNSECIIGYNSGVQSRLGLWPTGQQINGIVPGRGRIVFDLENGKSTASGQADMRFFSYNDYVDLYTKEGGYTGSSIWDSKKGGISDEAIKCAKSYVNKNWDKVKDNLVLWNDGGGHGRNGYSKLNYWLRKDDCVFIFLSLDYGDDTWKVTSGWHDRMIHARTILNLNVDDPYIRRMKEYVTDTKYSKADEPYNYQYYSPNTLIWLKEILENNTDKKVFIFTHHPIPNKVGNSIGIPQNGDYSYAVISKAGVLDNRGTADQKAGIYYNSGSNTLTGIEFWFINKLSNKYKNVVWFSGHSHISWDNDGHFDNHDYEIVDPAKQNEYVYTKANKTPIGEGAWTIALPSLSKPAYIGTNQKRSRLYDDAEMAILEIYENGAKLKGYKIKEKNKNVYNKNKPLREQVMILK